MTAVEITFEESAKEVILSFFDKIVDKEGFIVEDNKRIVASDGRHIKLEEFAGIRKDGMLVRGDLPSLIDLLEDEAI